MTISAEKKKTGFALMSEEKRKELGRKGGRTSQDLGTARRWTAEESRVHASAGGVKSGRVRKEKGGHRLGSRFTSETGRLAVERRYDLEAKRDPSVTWLGEESAL